MKNCSIWTNSVLFNFFNLIASSAPLMSQILSKYYWDSRKPIHVCQFSDENIKFSIRHLLSKKSCYYFLKSTISIECPCKKSVLNEKNDKAYLYNNEFPTTRFFKWVLKESSGNYKSKTFFFHSSYGEY